MLIVERHGSDACCDEFPVPQIDRKSKQVKEQWDNKNICNQYREKLAILNIENVKMCG